MFGDHGQPSLSEGHSLHASRPSRLCAQAQSGDDMPFQVRSVITDDGRGGFQIWQRDFSRICKELERRWPIESGVKHLLGSVVWAMMSLDGSIVASLENVNGFLAMYTPLDDLIFMDFEQKGVVPEVMLHILEEFVFLFGRHSIDNEIPHMIVCKVGKP
nr:hypothetical protein [Tanacetum cinerariifolium]